MSDFQLGLLAISVVILLAVVAYNKWEEWRLRHKTEAAFGAGHEDVLLDAEMPDSNHPPTPAAADANVQADSDAVQNFLHSASAGEYGADELARAHTLEHTLGEIDLHARALSGTIIGAPAETAASSNKSNAISSSAMSSEIPSAEMSSSEMGIAPSPKPLEFDALARGIKLDPNIDFIVQMECVHPFDSAALLVKADELFDETLLQSVNWEGYNDTQSAWERLLPTHSYTHVRVGLQLANRKGAASEEAIGAFLDAMRSFVLGVATQVEMPDPDEAVQRAAQLDAFCDEYDIQIGLSVFGRDGRSLTGTKLRALAESAGCRLGKDGYFRKLAEDGAELYSLGNAEPMPFHPETLKMLATRGVTVLFDVPRAPSGTSAFRAYIDFARHLAQTLDGVLLDDERKAIGQAAIDQIGAQLAQIHQAMAARGIPAGSPAALRLFA